MTSTTARENVVVAAVMGSELERSKVEISDLFQTVRCLPLRLVLDSIDTCTIFRRK